MGNEMGNRNVSGLQVDAEEEKSAVEGQEKLLQEGVDVVDVTVENHMIPEAEDKDFREKIEGLSSDDPSGVADSHVEKQTPEEKDQDDTELKPPQSLDAPKESNHAGSEGSEIQTAASSEEVSDHEKLVDPNLEEDMLGTIDHQIQKQLPIERDEVEISNSTFGSKSASHDVDPKFAEHELVDVHAETLVEDHDASPRDSDEFVGLSLSCHGEENSNLIDNKTAQDLVEIVVSENNEQDVEKNMDDLLLEDKASKEEKLLDMNTCEKKCENTSIDEVGNGLQEKTSTFTEMNLSMNEFSGPPLEAVPQAGSVHSFQEIFGPQDKSMVLTEQTKLIGSGSENGENYCDQISEQAVDELKTDEPNASQSEAITTESDTEKKEKETELDVKSSSSMEDVKEIEEAKAENNGNRVGFVEEVKEKEHELGTVPTELTVTDHNHEEDKPTEEVDEKEEEEEDPYENENDTNIIKTTEKCMSRSNSNKQAQECQQNVQTIPVEVAETETPIKVFDEICEKGEISAIGKSGYEARESVCVELRKSPSFDFDLSIEARSQESDQTPLLCHDRAAFRSLSTRDNVRFQIQNTTVKNEYGQGPLQYEAISVEEKTIRMERSDSEKLRAPFLSLLKKEEKGNVVITPQRRESHVADNKKVPSEEVVLKRKPKSFLFSTCICCAAAIH